MSTKHILQKCLSSGKMSLNSSSSPISYHLLSLTKYRGSTIIGSDLCVLPFYMCGIFVHIFINLM